MDPELLEQKVFVNYYAALDRDSGSLPLGQASDNIAQAIGVPAAVVYKEILDAPSPEDIRRPGIEVAARVINEGGYVFPWTVGDQALQEAKLSKGQYRERVKQLVVPPSTMEGHYREYVCSSQKLEKLPEIFAHCLQKGVTDVYVADDNKETIDTVSRLSGLMAARFRGADGGAHASEEDGMYSARKLLNQFEEIISRLPEQEDMAGREFLRQGLGKFAVHNFHVKPDSDSLGSFDAFARKIQETIAENQKRMLGKKFALVLDVDETLMKTKQQLSRAARRLYAHAQGT